MPFDSGPEESGVAEQINSVVRVVLAAAIIGCGALLWTLMAGVAKLEANVSAIKESITRFEGQIHTSMADRYRGADARRDLALRDLRLDEQARRLGKLERPFAREPPPGYGRMD